MKSQLGTDAKGSPAFPDGQVSESDAQALRALAEEISYPAAPRLEETALVLYDRDPGYIQAQWYVTPQALAEARRLFPGGGSGLRQVLRLCRLDRDGRAEVVASTPQGSDVSEGAGEDGFALPGDGAEYSCELGLESDAGGWLLLARSNRVRLGDRPLSPSWTAPVTDNPGARNGSLATAEQPEEVEDMPVEAALAAVGGALHPVFPNLDLDDVPSPGYSESLEEIPGRAWVQDRGLELPSGIPRDLVSYPETATDLPPGAELVDMPPPLLPSSPELNTATADMPGPIYDPRAALSSAVLSGGALPSMPDLELHAELIVHGRAAAGSSTVDLFGHPIAVGADGRFYIRRPIDISALEPLAASGGLPAWLEAAGHG